MCCHALPEVEWDTQAERSVNFLRVTEWPSGGAETQQESEPPRAPVLSTPCHQAAFRHSSPCPW